MSKLFEEMAQGTAEARAYMEGEPKGHAPSLDLSVSRTPRSDQPNDEPVTNSCHAPYSG